MKSLLKWGGIIVGLLLLIIGSIFTWAHFKTQTDLDYRFSSQISGMDSLVAVADLELGKRIVTVRNACIDCHGADLGGQTFVDDPAIGKFAGANLTPFAMKTWTNDEFARAIHHGIGKEGQALRFMPALEFNALSKADVAAVIAYLRQIPEVKKPSPPIEIGPLAKVLHATGELPLLLSTYLIDLEKPFSEKPFEAPTKEFGSYLANSACIGCHNPQFSGGPIPGGPPEFAPAADIRLGLYAEVWTEEAFMNCLKTGISPRTGEMMKFPMPNEIMKNLNETEMKALYAYLSSLK